MLQIFQGKTDEVRKHEQDFGSHFHLLLEYFTTSRLQSQVMQQEIEVINNLKKKKIPTV
jgi:hypothetical protein